LRLLLRRTSSRRFLRGFQFEEAAGDVTDAESLPAAVAAVDAVVHTAGLVKARSEAEFYAVNAQGAANLIAAVEQAAPALQRFVYVSSLAAHGPSADGAARPADTPATPVSAYGRSKLAGERFLRDSAITGRSVIFRPPVIYGPRDPALVPFFRLARMRVAPLLMGGHNRISIVYVEDVARAIAQATAAEADVGSKTYCPEDGAVRTWRDLLAAVEAAVGRRALRISAPRWAFTAAALGSEAFGFAARRAVSLTRDKVHEMAQRHWVCSSEDLRRDLGWSPAVDIREGARLTADWYRRERWI
jgi:nucleoside-diphosphate-sugar epimerase